MCLQPKKRIKFDLVENGVTIRRLIDEHPVVPLLPNNPDICKPNNFEE